MPRHLYQILQRGGRDIRTECLGPDGAVYVQEKIENEVDGLIDLLALLLQLDETVTHAHLCHHSVKRVFKLPGEEGFCGYRNLQMLLTYLARHRLRAGDRLPGVLDLQDDIERAWDEGFASGSRIETGGIRGTRKYIGTPEACTISFLTSYPKKKSKSRAHSLQILAYLNLNGIAHEAVSFRRNSDQRPRKDAVEVHEQLLEAVQNYFLTGNLVSGPILIDASVVNPALLISKVSQTDLAPLYLQHPGHSVTIVGFVVHENGLGSLLVFDPGYKPSQEVCKLLDYVNHFSSSSPQQVRAQLDRESLANLGYGNVARAKAAAGAAMMQGTLNRYLCEKEHETRGRNQHPGDDSPLARQQEVINLLIQAYKRGKRHLQRYAEYEVVAAYKVPSKF